MRKPVRIPPGEHAVMKVIWKHGPSTARQVIARLTGQSSWSARTVRTLLHRLVARRALSFARQGREYVYAAALPEAEHTGSEARRFLRQFSGLSLSVLESEIAAARASCHDQLRQLEEAIRASRTSSGPAELSVDLVDRLVRARALASEPVCPAGGAVHVEADGRAWCAVHNTPPPAPATGKPDRAVPAARAGRGRVEADPRHQCRAYQAALEAALGRFASGRKVKPVLSPVLLGRLKLSTSRPCPASDYHGDHTGRVWCQTHAAREVGNRCSDCYEKQLELERAARAYEADAGAPLVLDADRPEAMDALLASGRLAARPLCFAGGSYSRTPEGELSCSHHGPIQAQLLTKGERMFVRVNPRP